MNLQRHWLLLLCLPLSLFAADYKLPDATPADIALNAYFERETRILEENCLADLKTLDDWTAKRDEYRQQLFEMLSLSPLPPKTDLKPVVTGKAEHEQFTVEKLHFQSSPGLYVTANLYIPKALPKPAPTILYLSGHGGVFSNGVSYGNKVTYQHHGAWFARNGYVCMILDTLQLGEIQGLHHGTHRAGMWWWNSRGYTPAGVEAWNCIRALDYLETRPEVDKERFGATGRSGGGAYSWWIAALDDRIKAVAPVAGITDLHNHVVDGVVEGHCDCMYIVNTYRWDYPMLAALVAPRPLMIANTDSDYIFPLDGVVRLHSKVRRIYDLYKTPSKLALVITDGPHKDTQDLQQPVFRWFNRHLKAEDPLIEMAATKLFTPEQLRVFDELPGDAVNTNIHYHFVLTGESKSLAELKAKSFRGWPDITAAPRVEQKASNSRDGLQTEVYEFESQPHVTLQLHVVQSSAAPPKQWALHVIDADAPSPGDLRPGTAFFAPRGLGADKWSGPERKQLQIRRRFMLLGQTLDGMRVWDVRRAAQALRKISKSEAPITLQARGDLAVHCLYASLFESTVADLKLADLPESHMKGPDYLNVLRVLDIPQALALRSSK